MPRVSDFLDLKRFELKSQGNMAELKSHHQPKLYCTKVKWVDFSTYGTSHTGCEKVI